MFFNHQHHHQGWLNHTLVNNWSYTEYIPVVALYLMNMYMEVYYVQRDTWSIQFVAWQELSCQQGNTSVQLFINRGTPTVLYGRMSLGINNFAVKRWLPGEYRIWIAVVMHSVFMGHIIIPPYDIEKNN